MSSSDYQRVADFLKAHPTAGRDAVAKALGLGPQTARRLVWQVKNGVSTKGEKMLPTVEEARANYRTQQAKDAVREYNKLLTRVAAEREIIDQFKDVVSHALSETLHIFVSPPPTPKKSSHSEEQAVLVISDSHVGKYVSPHRTLGFGNYSPTIFLDRLAFIEEAVSSLILHHVVNPVEELNILLLGDLVEGMLSHSEEVPERLFVADQVLLASLAFYQMIAGLASVVPKVTCRGVVGNHGRWPSQKKMPTAGRFSNFDFVVMGQVQALLEAAGPSNAVFILEEDPFQVFDIYSWRFKVGHGDHLRGGDKSMGIPAHAIGREQNATTQRYAAKGMRPPDYYIVGDKHRAFVGPTATGRFLINGAFFSEDEFAMSMNFSPCRPFQLFFGVHPDHGRSWSYDLSLDNAKAGAGKKFKLPARLTEKL